jgi:molecular chaperone DnaK
VACRRSRSRSTSTRTASCTCRQRIGPRARSSRRREEADVRNQADSLVYQTEKLLKDQGDKLQSDEKSQLESTLGELKGALAGTDLEPVKKATETLMNQLQTSSQHLYESATAEQQAAADAAGGGSGDAAPNDDDVVDAEIVDDQSA